MTDGKDLDYPSRLEKVETSDSSVNRDEESPPTGERDWTPAEERKIVLVCIQLRRAL